MVARGVAAQRSIMHSRIYNTHTMVTIIRIYGNVKRLVYCHKSNHLIKILESCVM